MAGRNGHEDDGVATEILGVYVPNDAEAGIPALEGHLANRRLHRLEPGRERLRAFHVLRGAARKDPHAAYNLGSLLHEAAAPGRPKRRQVALVLFERAAERSLASLRDPGEPFAKAPKCERDLRDVASRALTNIGALLANADHLDEAASLFRRAAAIFPNPDTFVCLGNMGVYHPEETGVAPLDGIGFWEEAHQLGDVSPNNADDAAWRGRLVALARGVEKRYGTTTAAAWMAGPMHGILHEGRSTSVSQIVRTLAEADGASGAPWPAPAAFASEVVGGVIGWGRTLPLEARATIAASLVATLSRSRGGTPDRTTMSEALDLVASAEPLAPYIGDHEWQEVGPPHTDYLVDPSKGFDVRVRKLTAVVDAALRKLSIPAPHLCAAVLFHLGGGFRRTVCALAAQVQAHPDEPVLYVPAIHLVGERRHAH